MNDAVIVGGVEPNQGTGANMLAWQAETAADTRLHHIRRGHHQ